MTIKVVGSDAPRPDKGEGGVKDSGERQQYQMGAQRDTQAGKGRFDLLSPFALQRLARHMENGIQKYGERNWELGIPVSRYLDSGMRHFLAFLAGSRDEDHLAAVMWNAHCAIHTLEMIERGVLPPELDDVPDWSAHHHARVADAQEAWHAAKAAPAPVKPRRKTARRKAAK